MITNYYAKNFVLAPLSGRQSYSLDRAYIALSTTKPEQDGTNFTEPTEASYKRICISSSTSAPHSAALVFSEDSRSASNDEELHFDTTTASWGTITYVGIFDKQTGGNLLAYSALETPLQTTAKMIVTFKAGELVVKITDETAAA